MKDRPEPDAYDLWINSDASKPYAGKWILFSGGKPIAVADTDEDLMRRASEIGDIDGSISYVSREREVCIGGAAFWIGDTTEAPTNPESPK